MKQYLSEKRRTSLFVILTLVLSLTNGFTARAAKTITVTLRIEQDAATLLPPKQITMTADDLNRDYGIGLATGPDAAFSPLRALAKYMTEYRGATDETMSRYIMAQPSSYGGLFMNGLSLDGTTDGAASADALSGVYWSYAVNDNVGSVGISEAALSDSDNVVIYGLWSPYPAEDETLYTFFEKAEYTAAVGTPLTLTLMTHEIQWTPDSAVKGVAGATLTAAA